MLELSSLVRTKVARPANVVEILREAGPQVRQLSSTCTKLTSTDEGLARELYRGEERTGP